MLQKHSRWITRFLLLLFIVTIMGNVYAEDDDTVFTVPYLLIQGDAPSSQANLIFESVIQNMQAFNINIQFEREESLEVDFTSGLITLLSDEQMLFAYQANNIATLSPMLVDSFISVRYTLPESNESENLSAELTGLLLYITGHYDLAESALMDVINSPHTSEGHNTDHLHALLANINILQSDYTEAERHYRSIADNNNEVTVNLAWVLVQRGETQSAFELLNTLLETAIVDEQIFSELFALRARAWLYALTFDYDNAIADMNTAIDIAEANDDISASRLAELYTTRGEIVFLIYEWDRVEDNFNTAIELDPEHAPAYFQRGILFYTVTRREDAQADFETYLELAPDGIYAEQATSYIESIDIELEALGN